MIAAELIQKVRRIEIKTRGLSQQVFAGQYHSAFKGQGMTFSEVREYQYGDPIRSIDWNVTARFNKPYIKIFDEERELTVMLLVDVSGSNDFGTRNRLKRELMTELAAVLAFSAIENNDKIGVIFFSDRVEKFIPPKKGKKHILRIILELLEFKSVSRGTNITEALRFLTHAIKKKSTVFVISDFMLKSPVEVATLKDGLRIANRKHDMIVLQTTDPGERQLPNIGLARMLDPETLSTSWIDTSSRRIRAHYDEWWLKVQSDLETVFRSCGIDYISLLTTQDYVNPLIQLFKKRGRK
ncbi:MAG: DUF58 domain-containing protein [Bacteroidales bacterium]|jgi:uncharacterized protein (DUF58 family)